MTNNLLLNTRHLQAELIVEDIQYSGKAYLRAISARDDLGQDQKDVDWSEEVRELLNEARQRVAQHEAKVLLAGFLSSPKSPAIPGRDTPPAGFVFYTDFIHLTADTARLRENIGQPPNAVDSAGSRQRPAASAIRRIPLTAARIVDFLDVHIKGMRGVPNVPVLTEADVLEQQPSGSLHLIELPAGQLVGFYDLAIHPDQHSADLDELAVLPAWRNQGIGRLVIVELAEQLAAADIVSLNILVASMNEAALRLYRRLGFAAETLYSRWFRQDLV